MFHQGHICWIYYSRGHIVRNPKKVNDALSRDCTRNTKARDTVANPGGQIIRTREESGASMYIQTHHPRLGDILGCIWWFDMPTNPFPCSKKFPTILITDLPASRFAPS